MQVLLTSIGFTKIFLDVSSLSFSFLQMLMLYQLKMRHLKKICETDAGQMKEQDVPLTWDSLQVWSASVLLIYVPNNLPSTK